MTNSSAITPSTLELPDLLTPCRTPAALHNWIRYHLGLSIPTKSVCPDHKAPFDYLWAAYREPRDLVVWAPRGGGKTTLGAIATLLDLLHKPGCSIRILGGSLEQSLRMWEQLNPMIYKVAQDLLAGKDRARHLTLKNGSTAAVLTQSQRAVRGLRVQKLRCDEVELFKPDIWEAAQLTTRSKSASEITLPDDCTQEKQDIPATIEALSTLHEPFGLMQEIITSAEQRRATVIKWCLLDVLEHCPPERECVACALHPECQGRAKTHAAGFFKIEDALTMKHRVSKQSWESEMLCLRPSRKAAVFAEFNPDVHVRVTPPWGDAWPARDGAWGCGIDFGFANPFVCLWVQFDRLGYCFVVDEYVQSTRIMESHIIEMKSRPWPLPRFLGVDPSGKQCNGQTATSHVRLLREAGHEVRERHFGIHDGLEIMHAALAPAIGEPTLYIHPRCHTLIRSMINYRYAHPRDENPLKDGVNDHAADALRYFLTNRTGGETKHGCY